MNCHSIRVGLLKKKNIFDSFYFLNLKVPVAKNDFCAKLIVLTYLSLGTGSVQGSLLGYLKIKNTYRCRQVP